LSGPTSLSDILTTKLFPADPRPDPKPCPSCKVNTIEAESCFQPRTAGRERGYYWLYPSMCEDCKAGEQRRLQHAANVSQLYARAGINPNDPEWRFDGPKPWDHSFNPETANEPGAEVAFDWCATLIRDFPLKLKQGRGLLFLGPTGTGKSRLARSTVTAIIDRWEAKTACIYVPDFLEEKKRSFSPEAKLVLLDEIKVKPWQESAFTSLMEKLVLSLPVVIGTTNYATPQAIEAAIGAAAYSRLMRLCTLVSVTGRDYRGKEAEQFLTLETRGEAAV
jgi:DNA replication protein DnaC